MTERQSLLPKIFQKAATGFPIGVMTVYLICLLGGVYSVQSGGYGVQVVTAAMAELWGNPVAAALVQFLWSGLLGAVLWTAGMPFQAERRVVLWSGLHFLATAAVFSLAGWQCRWFLYWESWLCLLGILLVLYLLLWGIRYIGWRQDVQAIRLSIGLTKAEKAPRPEPVSLQAILPYLMLAAAVELTLPPLLRSIDAQDVPVLTGIFYPFLILPLFCFFSALAMGKRFRFRWVVFYGVLCALLTLPHIFWLYNVSALFQVYVAGIAVFLGGGLAVVISKIRGNNTD